MLGEGERVSFPELRPSPEGLFDLEDPQVRVALALRLRATAERRADKDTARARAFVERIRAWLPPDAPAGPAAPSPERPSARGYGERTLTDADLELDAREREELAARASGGKTKRLDARINALAKRLAAGGYDRASVERALAKLEEWGAKDGTLKMVRRAYSAE